MPVFHQYNTAKDILTQLSDTSEVKELLDIADKHVTSLCNAETQLKFPFVVIEGMDATGKTTLTEAIERKLGAVKYFTPPPQISHLRPHFDRYPEIVRRAYYSLGNYIVAMDILRECETRPVIMDRFWHSTAAYGIANETSMSDLPGAGHPVYDWPGDLVRPTLVLFLTVQEEVRRRRLSDRGVLATFEETALDKDGLFRKRLCNAYRLMGNPALVEIDASGTVKEVRNTAIELLKQHGICLQTDM
ncbi:hypothetical protein DPMN_057768 [Dreissena polymorpha]|uniref:Thymidylate kinase-like domain-containing protein n=2 Tax=Dreissena polymorpha TaxID=45954 RepID=A0A9D4C0V7_DREPO|nr:hypothetical protein DPMN_057768 [Dreissena polymorpha]